MLPRFSLKNNEDVFNIIEKDFIENINKESEPQNRNIAILDGYNATTFPIGIRYKGRRYSIKKSKKGDIFLHRNFSSLLATIKVTSSRNRLKCELIPASNEEIIKLNFSAVNIFPTKNASGNYEFCLNKRFLDALEEGKDELFAELPESKNKVFCFGNVFFEYDKSAEEAFFIDTPKNKGIIFTKSTKEILLNMFPVNKDEYTENTTWGKIFFSEGFGCPVTEKNLLLGKVYGNTYNVFPSFDLTREESLYFSSLFDSNKTKFILSKYPDTSRAVFSLYFKNYKRGDFEDPNSCKVILGDCQSFLKLIQKTITDNKGSFLRSALAKELFIPATTSFKDILNAIEILDAAPRIKKVETNVRFFFKEEEHSVKNTFFDGIFGTGLINTPVGTKFDIKEDGSFQLNMLYNGVSAKRKKQFAKELVKFVKSKTGYSLGYYFEKV